MRQSKLLLLLAIILFAMPSLANEPDSAYIFVYSTKKNTDHNGMHIAWSVNNKDWRSIGPEHAFLKSDYGTWGPEKRMVSPYVYRDANGLWHCIWSVNEKDGAFSYTTSKDLIYWKTQSYPVVSPENCLMPEISYDGKKFTITWLSGNGQKVWLSSTTDFKNYEKAQQSTASKRVNDRKTLEVNGEMQMGTVHKVSFKEVDNLIKTQQIAAYRSDLYSERITDDAKKYANLKPLTANISLKDEAPKKISDLLIGIFFEDISYAADGGLYGELLQNRDFEYDPADRDGRDKNWNSTFAWSVKGENATFKIDTVAPIHENNKHYAVLDVTKQGAGLANTGYNGVSVKQGEKYDVSLFARGINGNKSKLIIRLQDRKGNIIGETVTSAVASDWKKMQTVITAKSTNAEAVLVVIPQKEGQINLDFISLFPQNTFMKRKNGLRADLAQVIADMKPKFVRFPGGCVAHGDGLGNMYRWNRTVGPLESRVQQPNIWNYHQSAGLGYFEYFRFCEDIGAQPLPVLPAGVPCQNSSTGGAGQQGGLPMCEMDNYIQEVLDLIEWANGDVKTKWGKIRAEAGHPKPFNLKYVGIGNEDLISDVFEERFKMIFDVVKQKHPEITVVGTVGPFYEGTDYVEGWRIATEQKVPIVDEHYYNSPGWFINNQDFYDRYDRSKSKVYLGEYAAHIPNRQNNIETALAEALYLTSVERNGDIVEMTSYAPLLAKEGHTNWNPDLIYFNNTEVMPTVGYHVQKLYGNNSGDQYLPGRVMLSDMNSQVTKRFGSSIVKDSKTNDLIIKLVNMLPVETNTNVDLKGLNIKEGNSMMTVLKGEPSDRNAKPEVSTIKTGEKFQVKLPAYSFTVIRISAAK